MAQELRRSNLETLLRDIETRRSALERERIAINDSQRLQAINNELARLDDESRQAVISLRQLEVFTTPPPAEIEQAIASNGQLRSVINALMSLDLQVFELKHRVESQTTNDHVEREARQKNLDDRLLRMERWLIATSMISLIAILLIFAHFLGMAI